MHDVDHTNEEGIMFVLVMPKSQKVPTRKIHIVLVMPMCQKDPLYRFMSVLIMPQSLHITTRKNHCLLASHAKDLIFSSYAAVSRIPISKNHICSTHAVSLECSN